VSAAAAGAAASTPYLWYLSRGSGVVLLLLFSVVVVLGVATRLGTAPRWLARFSIAELHRTLSLFGVALLALHVITAMLDPYVSIGWLAAIVPFVSHYRALAIGAGTLAVDAAAAVLVTSLVRARLGFRAWRAVHWLAYLAWPAAMVHSLTAGGDLGVWWVAAAECVSAAMVAMAVIARLLSPRTPGGPAGPRATSRDRDAGGRPTMVGQSGAR
jgi:sulfoxide reductase heme-binding subunit YedZ